MWFRLVSCGTLVLSYLFDVKLEEIHDKSLTMILAIEKVLDDFSSNILFVREHTTSNSHNQLKPNELLDELLQFMSNQPRITLVINSVEKELTRFRNTLLIVDGFESFS